MKKVLDIPKLGKIEYYEKDVISFEEGILGYEKLTAFIIIRSEESELFSYMQSLQNADMTFVICRPEVLVKDYKSGITAEDMTLACASSDDPDFTPEIDIDHFVIVTIPDKLSDISINLLGPLVINRKSKRGWQFISTNPDYSTKHNIASEIEKWDKNS